ncbi:solute carrier family 26 member 6 isoform X2 [Phascolarctos cinereus]|uniref:Solute carrier family 26 member 6 isoform X2 n=1 Tax=Phascolarctos cinereus TaxID=38626 RepID=A0A6P5LD53_PHACI|nr:solute carrier family 26 member 6 isoform X2 [Phascolarctos cinereus]
MGPLEPPGPRDTQALLASQDLSMEKLEVEPGPLPCDYRVDRRVLNEQELEETGQRSQSPKPSRWFTLPRCSTAVAWATLCRFLPILSWLPKYPAREFLLGDLLSGLSVGIVQLPQGLAYALLAGLPPVFGLYSSFYPVFVYFLFGTSRHISVGTFAVISVMVGSVSEALAPNDAFLVPGNDTEVNEIARDATRVKVASALSFLVGVFQVGMGLLQFGFVVTYLSEPLVRGYTTAASVQVLVSQLKHVFGLSVKDYSGPLSQIYIVLEIIWKLPESNVGTVVTALIASTLLLAMKIINQKLGRKLPVPMPSELIMLIGATAISYGVGLKEKFKVDIVGNIPAGLEPPQLFDYHFFGKIVGNAFAISVVGFAIAISLGKIFGMKHGYEVDNNQELIALGLSNFFGSFFQCFPISCSMSRSLVQEGSGGNTQIAGAISSLLILIVIIKLGELFYHLPKAILASIIIVNLKGMFVQFSDICYLWKANRVDLLIWLVTFVATVLLNLDIGLAVAIVFSLLSVVFRTQLPHYSILGQVPDTDIYRDVTQYKEAREVPGVKIFSSSATLYFANAEFYRQALKEKIGLDVDHLIAKKKKLIKKQRLKTKKLQKKENRQKKAAARKVPLDSSEPNSMNVKIEEMDIENAQVGGVDRPDNAVVNDKGFTLTLEALGLPQPHFHNLILDLGTLNFVDTVCIKTLKNIFRDFQEIEVNVYLAGCHGNIISQFESGNFFEDSITKGHLFVSIHDAVTFALMQPRPRTTQSVLATRM